MTNATASTENAEDSETHLRLVPATPASKPKPRTRPSLSAKQRREMAEWKARAEAAERASVIAKREAHTATERLSAVMQPDDAPPKRHPAITAVRAAFGAIVGAVVPAFANQYVHTEVNRADPTQTPIVVALILGALLFSAPTVYEWACVFFGSRYKALGFVVLVEGSLTFSQTPWVGAVALGLLVAINSVATAARGAR